MKTHEFARPDAGANESGPIAPAPRAPRRRTRDALIVAVGLAVGISAPAIAGQVKDRFHHRAAENVAAVPAGRASKFPIPDLADAGKSDAVASTPAPTPTEAVDRFLTAETQSDHDRSFALLSKSDRAGYRSPAAWRAAHATIFPVVGFDVRKVDNVAGRRLVIADVRYNSTIDEVVGVVPARASVSWPVVEEDGGWLVDFTRAQVRAELPPEADAATAARRWATERQKCASTEEYSAGLVGRASLAKQLCDAQGSLSVGSVARLDTAASTAFVSAFGDSVTAWARTVALAGPVPMTVVLAPVKDTWLVIGVLDPR